VVIELEVIPNESDRKVHALATIQGRNNLVALTAYEGENRNQDLPILIGYTHPEHGESMSPYGEGACDGLKFRNETNMPAIIGEKARNCEITTAGPITDNKGIENTVISK
jgi:hypothetical protein